ncbi:hypothetical protein ACI3KS_11545 [Microbacterium sp. ZW T5_45]|uniref:hypothetical protein n=1 Tax=Microbacterium sp. ZW T5_45 TaxID=3378080 RepID=UPI00385497F5
MAIKHTPLSVQNELTGKIEGFHDRANAIKQAYHVKSNAIRQDDRLSDAAKIADQAELKRAVTEQLKSIRDEQEAYISNLKSSIETELRGKQATDANSIMLRRDASDRARKVDDKREAMAVLQDALNNGDDEMAHAIGTRARAKVWLDVAEAWKDAFPSTAGVAEALTWVEDNTTSGTFNLSNSATYSAPLD